MSNLSQLHLEAISGTWRDKHEPQLTCEYHTGSILLTEEQESDGTWVAARDAMVAFPIG